jgi:hypothetical protein
MVVTGVRGQGSEMRGQRGGDSETYQSKVLELVIDLPSLSLPAAQSPSSSVSQQPCLPAAPSPSSPVSPLL